MARTEGKDPLDLGVAVVGVQVDVLPDRHPRDKLWRHFLDAIGTLPITDDQVACALNLRSYHPSLIDGGLADLDVPSPGGGPHPPLPSTSPPR